jgi:hypothetical protein
VEINPLSLLMRAVIDVDSVTQWVVAISISRDYILTRRQQPPIVAVMHYKQ